MHGELLAFLKIERQVDDLLLSVGVNVRSRGEIDVTEFAVELREIFQALPHARQVENVAGLHLHETLQRLRLEKLVSANGEFAQVVLLAFLHGNGDVNALSVSPTPEKEGPVVRCIAHFGLRFFRQRVKVSVLLVKFADFFQVIQHFVLVVGFVEKVEERGQSRGTGQLHLLHQSAVRKDCIACESDSAHFHLGAFGDDEGQRHGVGRNIPGAVDDGGKLAAVNGQELGQDHFGPLDDYRIILGLDGQAHLVVLVSL